MLRRILLSFLLFFSAPLAAQIQIPGTPAGADWPFEANDLPVDPQYRFGVLDNGMRYIIRPNATPPDQGMVQFYIDGGSLYESEDERGFAHFIEHMAFNGSTDVPEGEMVRLLEREGLAFGADTNAATGFDTTIYRLDLPRADPELLDTALMLMRQIGSELSFKPEAVEREKGVLLSERRVRDTFAMRNMVDQMSFFYPDTRFSDRMPIGTEESLRGATAERLRALWQKMYRPDNAALIVIGDYDADAVEQAIRDHFEDWEATDAPPQPAAGPVPVEFAGETDIFIDPALSERVAISRHGSWIGEPDSLDFRQRNVRRQLGYAILNRRFQRLAREQDPPFRSAGISSSEVFGDGRTTTITVDAAEGEWRRGLAAAQQEYRRALEFGFTRAEVDEQLANLRSALENNVSGAETRNNFSFVTGALTLLQDGQTPTTPASALGRFENHLPDITPQSVMEALREEMVPLENPLIRFEGRTPPEGGAEALRAAWVEGMAAQLEREAEADLAAFAYTDFGPPGSVVSDKIEPELGIRTITFDNGLKLNLKTTELQRDRVAIRLNVDGGKMLNTRDNPLATAMTSVLPMGGLGEHSIDELQSIMAGHSVGFSLDADDETFRMGALTTPRDLELQLQVLAAAITDPGYRPEGEAQYGRNVRNFFARIAATPENALSNKIGAIVTDGDPRFTIQPIDSYLDLSFERLHGDIQERLDHGALELALVGDFDEASAIEAVARTLGAVPQRESEFRPYADNRERHFTADRRLRILRHNGASDQALLRMSWPTTDDSDLAETLALSLLDRVMQIALTDSLREELGQTYSPAVNSSQSSVYPGYGSFNIASAIAVTDVETAREAMLQTIQTLIANPVDEDVLLRARAPLIESYDNALKTNAGWMSLVDRAQSESDRIERFLTAREVLAGLTGADVQAVAGRYLDPDERLEILVLPQDDDPPSS